MQNGEISTLWLGVDACGSTGSVAVGRLTEQGFVAVEQRTLDGRQCAAQLIPTIDALLGEQRPVGLVVVHGPGSFTGVRIGLSLVQGLAEVWQVPVVALSRLAVLAQRAGTTAAALDAHRAEVFLRLEDGQELLADAEELAHHAAPARIALAEARSEALIGTAWPTTELVQATEPTAADALQLAVAEIAAGRFAERLQLDGHYLRRSDAEIFGGSKRG